MTALEIKVDLLDIISKEENVEKLELLRAFVKRYLHGNAASIAADEALTDEQEEEIRRALEEINDKNNLISDKDARKILAQWL